MSKGGSCLAVISSLDTWEQKEEECVSVLRVALDWGAVYNHFPKDGSIHVGRQGFTQAKSGCETWLASVAPSVL